MPDVGIRFPYGYLCRRMLYISKRTDCHDQFANWSRNDVFLFPCRVSKRKGRVKTLPYLLHSF